MEQEISLPGEQVHLPSQAQRCFLHVWEPHGLAPNVEGILCTLNICSLGQGRPLVYTSLSASLSVAESLCVNRVLLDCPLLGQLFSSTRLKFVLPGAEA